MKWLREMGLSKRRANQKTLGFSSLVKANSGLYIMPIILGQCSLHIV